MSSDLGASASPPVRVLYFAGTGRSGTTVINNIVGQLPGAFAAGELRYLWRRGVVEDRLCGCGQPFSTCPVWTAVMSRAYAPESGWTGGAPDAEGVTRRLYSRLRLMLLPRMLLRRAGHRPAIPGHPDDRAIAQLYAALAAETGASVIVDTSKLPPYGLLLDGLPGIELVVLHVIRDPRATAFSWGRRKKTHDGVGDDDVMQRQAVWKSSMLWLVWNAATVLVWGGRRSRSRGRYIRVRYEDFVASPQQTMTAIAELAGLDPAALPFETPTSVRLAPTHTVAGNPMRHASGAIELRPDSEWTRAMPRRDRAVVTAVTAPVLVGLGYTLKGPAS